MMYPRWLRQDPFEIMVYARRSVFVRATSSSSLIVTALLQSVSVSYWRRGDHEPTTVRYHWQTATQLGLYDGQGWDLQALAAWLGRQCIVCGVALTGNQKLYHSIGCKQKAYRSRK